MAYSNQLDLLEPINLTDHLDKVELYLGQVCHIAGISKMQLDYWTNKAQIPTKGKKQRIYDIEALETVMLIKQAKDKGSEPRRRDRRCAAVSLRASAAARRGPCPNPSGLRQRPRIRHEGREHVDRRGEDDRGRVRGADLEQRLQVAQLQRHRRFRHHVGCVGELLRGLELALGCDDLGPPLPLGLRLTRHRALHRRGNLDVLHLDDRDLDAPR